MKKVFPLLLCYALATQVQAQSYRAKTDTGTSEVPVPKAVVRKFKKEHPKAQIDSCYIYGNDADPEGEVLFYAKQGIIPLEATYDKRGKPVRSKTEVAVQDLPEVLQQSLTNNDIQAEGIGKAYKLVTWLSKRKKTKRRKKLPRRAKVEYMVEFFTTYNGKKLKVPMYFNESGHQANPGFR